MSWIKLSMPFIRWDVSRSWSRWLGFWARQAKDSVALFRRSSVGVMPDRTSRLSVGVGRRHPVTRRKASLMGLSMRRVCALRLQTEGQGGYAQRFGTSPPA